MTQHSDVEQNERITVVVDSEIKGIVPIFLENRQGDVKAILEALDRRDYETIRILGHSLQGAGGGYGFDVITEIGQALNRAAKEERAEEIRRLVDELSSYLQRVDVTYES
jgi:HPt (histidine-containing phosphotransfer) domain-containing protein